MRTSTEYRRPYRPLAVSLFNQVGRAARRCGFGGALDVGRMIAAARRRTGLSDFGDEWFLEPLEVLVESINAEARLTALGATIQRSRIVSALAIRLRAARLLREHPEILDVDLGRILLIAGLQRTATTTLHRLLAADPGTRALRAWEVLNPVPLGDEGTGAPRRRMRQAKRAARAIGFLAPDFRAVHPMAWDAPEEDVLLLDLSFMSQAPEAAMHVPSYSRWLEARDHTKCYEYMLTVLKILHWQGPSDRWLLKTPHHMEHLDVILDVFPDVCVIQTHRDPKKSVPSFCSMVAHGRGIFSDHVDPVEIGAHWMRKIRRMMERSMSVRRSADEHVFVDVSFYDLIADPLGELRRIYGAAGIDFTEEAADAARNVSERSGKDGHGRHVYAPASFGLDEETIDRHSAAYRWEYRIPDEVVT
ncbi:MAG: sulfotransferase [Gemmatimonadota bacterium]|nr:sulfotransferase [Gemmatimonadota bacterium]